MWSFHGDSGWHAAAAAVVRYGFGPLLHHGVYFYVSHNYQQTRDVMADDIDDDDELSVVRRLPDTLVYLLVLQAIADEWRRPYDEHADPKIVTMYDMKGCINNSNKDLTLPVSDVFIVYLIT